jgi:hypothetical protein
MTRVLVSLLLFVSGIPAMAQTVASCTFTTFQIPGFSGTRPSGINRYGNVVGSVYVQTNDAPPDTTYTAFIRYADGAVKLFRAPGTSSTDSTQFQKRNALGATTGAASGIGGFVYYKGTWQPVTGPNGTGGPSGINLYGTLVGSYLSTVTNGPVRGFKLKDGKYSVINFPQSSETEAVAISDTGVIIGNYGAADGFHHGFVLKNGVYTNFDNPFSVNPPVPNTRTQVEDINASGAIVGLYFNGKAFVPFLYKDGVFKDVVVPGYQGTTVMGINGYGTITGSTSSSQGVEVGFIGTNCH